MTNLASVSARRRVSRIAVWRSVVARYFGESSSLRTCGLLGRARERAPVHAGRVWHSEQLTTGSIVAQKMRAYN